MNNYRVGYWQTDYGFFEIKAKSKKEAKEKAQKLHNQSSEFICKDVHFGIEDIEKV